MINLLLLCRLSLGFWTANHRPYLKRQMLLHLRRIQITDPILLTWHTWSKWNHNRPNLPTITINSIEVRALCQWTSSLGDSLHRSIIVCAFGWAVAPNTGLTFEGFVSKFFYGLGIDIRQEVSHQDHLSPWESNGMFLICWFEYGQVH